MKSLRQSGAFKKDLKRLLRRGYDLSRLDAILQALQKNESLPATARPHPLKGDWKGYWDCHVASDWILIYKVTDDEVRLARTGTHADLFE
jgi:mRNA interferase YafQ